MNSLHLKKKQKKLTPKSTALDSIEMLRLDALLAYEREGISQGFQCIVGVDEAGRGPLAGPVVAAACYIPEGIYLAGVDDSKKLSVRQRGKIYASILENKSIVFGIGIVDAEEIDRVNIYQATITAMWKAVGALQLPVDLLLVDGMPLQHPIIISRKIIKGDSKSQSIAAASVLAKETRDKMMCDYDKQWPHYGFAGHKGYGTERHRSALQEHGPCPIHRTTFSPVKELISLSSNLERSLRS